MDTSTSSVSPVTDLGYHYSDWIWEERSSDFMKSMLLFFDGLALSLPSDLAEHMIDRDPVLAAPLSERGLLLNFIPDATLDEGSAERLALTLTEFTERPALDSIHRRALGRFHWGGDLAARATVKALEQALMERWLITPRAERGLYYMEIEVRFLVLTRFAQVPQTRLGEWSIILYLTTDSEFVASGGFNYEW